MKFSKHGFLRNIFLCCSLFYASASHAFITFKSSDVILMLAAFPFVYVGEKIDNVQRGYANSLSPFNRAEFYAKRGNVYDMAKLSMMYATGNGTPVDDQLALEWMEKSLSSKDSVDSGALEAYFQKSNRLIFGIGLHKDVRAGVKMMENIDNRINGAGQRLDIAGLNMAFLYHVGYGVSQDFATRDAHLFRAIKSIQAISSAEAYKPWAKGEFEWNDERQQYQCNISLRAHPQENHERFRLANELERCAKLYFSIAAHLQLMQGKLFHPHADGVTRLRLIERYYRLSLGAFFKSKKVMEKDFSSLSLEEWEFEKESDIFARIKYGGRDDAESLAVEAVSLMCLFKMQQAEVLKGHDPVNNECKAAAEKGEPMAQYLYGVGLLHGKSADEKAVVDEGHRMTDEAKIKAIRYLSMTAQKGFSASVYILNSLNPQRSFGVPVND